MGIQDGLLEAKTTTMTVKVKATLHRNRAPTIIASDVDLGKIVGCLTNGLLQVTKPVTVAMFNPVTTARAKARNPI
jgi:hypothetical protein